MANIARIEKERRLRIVADLWLKGATAHDILEYFKKNLDIDIGESTVYLYIKRAKQKIEALSDYVINQEFAKAAARYDQIYSEAMAAEDHKTALAAEKARVDLFGLADRPIEITMDATALMKQAAESMKNRYNMPFDSGDDDNEDPFLKDVEGSENAV
jgi:hypothetical protein